LDNYHATSKESVFAAAVRDSTAIPVGIFRSLASMIGISPTRTKPCPFCEETIHRDACSCSYCSRILMKPMNFKTRK